MRIKADADVEGLLPWLLELEIGGVAYATRRPTLGLLTRLMEMESLAGSDAMKIVGELFEGPVPWEDWDCPTFAAVVSHYMKYAGEQIAKNSRTVAARIAAATVKPAGAAAAAAARAS